MKIISRKLIIKTFTFFLCLLISNLLYSQNKAELKVKIDSTDILIGDQIKYNIDLKFQKDQKIAFPDLSEFFPEKIEIVKQSKIDTVFIDNIVNLQKNVIITSFDTGYYKIPELKSYFKNNNKLDSIVSEPMFFKVYSVKIDTTKAIKDIKAPIEAPVTFKEILPYLLIGIAAIILLLVIIYIVRKIKRKEPILKINKPKEPPYIVAIRELTKLKNQKLWQDGKIKSFHTKLTDIIRTYLFDRYKVRTYERTSTEILQSLKISDFNDDNSLKLLQEMFYISDLVKFAKYLPIASDNEMCFDNAMKFIENTKLVIEEKNEDNLQEKNDDDK